MSIGSADDNAFGSVDAGDTLRVFLFDGEPNCLLICAPSGAVRIPPLVAPFDKYSVACALGDEGVRARVEQTVPGELTPALQRIAKKSRAERASIEKLRQLRSATILKEVDGDRSAAILRRLAVEDEVRTLTAEIKRLRQQPKKSRDAQAISDLERRRDALKQESQVIQVRLAEMRRAESEARERDRRNVADRFVKAAYAVLGEETFQGIMAVATGETETEKEENQ